MKVTLSQIEVGLMSYIDKEIAGQMDGLKKLMVIGAETVMIGKVEGILTPWLGKDIVKSIGIVDESGMIDLDLLRDALTKAMEKTGPVTQDIPFIGKVTFKQDDISQLYNFIRSA